MIKEYNEEKSEMVLNNITKVVEQLKEEQTNLNEIFSKLRSETSDYVAPDDGCQTFVLTYELFNELNSVLLNQFEIEN